MENFTLEQIITVSVLCIWFAFPIGMLISFMRQSNEQIYPKDTTLPEKNFSHHIYPQHKHFGIKDFDEDDDIDEDDDEYVDIEMPTTHAYQVPKKRQGQNNWKL